LLNFSSVNFKVYICEIHKFYYDTPSTTKSMAVRSAKCHFVSEQQLISSITRKRYCLITVKKHDMLMLVTEMSTNCFLHAWSLFRNDSIAVLIWALRQVSSHRLHNILHLRKCWTALACNIGTCQALHPIRNIPVG